MSRLWNTKRFSFLRPQVFCVRTMVALLMVVVTTISSVGLMPLAGMTTASAPSKTGECCCGPGPVQPSCCCRAKSSAKETAAQSCCSKPEVASKCEESSNGTTLTSCGCGHPSSPGVISETDPRMVFQRIRVAPMFRAGELKLVNDALLCRFDAVDVPPPEGSV